MIAKMKGTFVERPKKVREHEPEVKKKKKTQQRLGLTIDTFLSDVAEISCIPYNSAVLSKFVGPVGQSDIFYECLTKNVGVPDQMSDRK